MIHMPKEKKSGGFFHGCAYVVYGVTVLSFICTVAVCSVLYQKIFPRSKK